MNHPTPDILHHWPLVIIVYDCYVPESAQALLDGLTGIDDDSCAVGIKLMAMDAERELVGN